ncbi:MAG: 30S ribosomal protein S16 [Candidatus Omnitrophota bacterium]|nr:MAG: 30S ribosomal protein S16 [Candidatus Omnitrophota bacterium]
MAVAIRLKRLGTNKKPHSRIIVCESSRARDARIIDKIGFYNPTKNPPLVKVDKEKAEKWLKAGARPSETVRSIFKRQGIV